MPKNQSWRLLRLLSPALLLFSCGVSPTTPSTDESKSTQVSIETSESTKTDESTNESQSEATSTHQTSPQSESETSEEITSIVPASPLDTVKALLAVPYDHICLDVAVSKDGLSLNSSFEGERKGPDEWEVKYAVETYSLLDIDNPTIEEKNVSKGTLTYKDGKLVSSAGKEVEFNPSLLELDRISLNEAETTIHDSGNGYLILSTASLGPLLGTGKKQVGVEINFDLTSIEEIGISFTDERGYEVQYSFHDIN